MPLDGGIYKSRKGEQPEIPIEVIQRRARVMSGLALLNKHRPGWQEDPRISELDIAQPTKCPGAIAFGSYKNLQNFFGLTGEQLVPYGFDALDWREYHLLTQEWCRQLNLF